MRVNTNVAALNAWRNLSSSTLNLQKSLEKLSSGFRINKAADDAAGLAVSEKMRAQIRGINQAIRNTQDGIALVQTAEGGAGQIQDMLQRMRELAVQASSGGLNDSDRAQLHTEFNQLKTEITRSATTISYNNIGLLSGSTSTSTSNTVLTSNAGVATFTAGATATAGQSNIVTVTALADTAKANVSTSFTAATGTGAANDSGYVLKINNTTVYQAAAGAQVDKAQIAAAINSNTTLNATLTASYDSVSGALTIQSKNTGSAQSFTIDEFYANGSTAIGAAAHGLFGATATVTKTGTDASYSVNGGAAVTSATNNGVAINTGITANLTAIGTTSTTVQSATSTSSTGNVTVSLQIGANAGDTVSLQISNMSGTALGITGLDISTAANISAGNVIGTLDTAISTVSSARAALGAYQNRLENIVGSLTVQSENLTGAESRIRDVDMASEMARFTKHQVLTQAGTAMLAQANQAPQAVLSLLRG